MNFFTKLKKYHHILLAAVAVVTVPQIAHAFAMFDVGVFLLQLFARILAWAGIGLNFVFVELVFEMGLKVQQSFGASLENSWAVVRDMMNLLFIFSLIYIGFNVILDGGTSGARRMLPSLIMAALLINFSLFFTKVIIDVTNIAAIEIYQTFSLVPAGSTDAGEAENAMINVGISGAFMQILGLKDLLSPQRTNDEARAQYQALMEDSCVVGQTEAFNCQVTGLVFFMVAIMFFLIATYAFAVGAFMIVWRFIVLIFLMIFSPLMFAGWIFPKASRYTSMWWGTFMNAAFFAPAYLLMLYISYKIGSRIGVMDNGDTFFSAASGSFTMFDVIMNYFIVIGFLLASVAVGRQMSFYGSKATMGMVDNLKNRGQRALRRTAYAGAGAGIAAAGYTGRQTIGKFGQKTAEGDNAYGERLRLQAQGRGINAWLARRQLDVANKAAGASYDGRALLSKDAQKTFGGPQKGGYAQKIKDRKKADEAAGERYGGQDSQVYTDFGTDVVAQKKRYDDMVKERKNLERSLAITTDSTERQRLFEEISTKAGLIKEMEEGKRTEKQEAAVRQIYVKQYGATFADHNNAGGTMTQSEWDAKMQERDISLQKLNVAAARFAAARKQEKGYGARRYARSQEVRYDKNAFTRFVGNWVIDDAYARKQGAEAIFKKNSTKDSASRIKDILKEDEKDETPAPAPAAPAAS